MGSEVLAKGFYDSLRDELEGRVSAKRLNHIDGVADTARRLAEVYGANVAEAGLAGLLHDWDKGLNDEQIRARVAELQMESEIDPWVVSAMPQVLHGPTAAKSLHMRFPDIPQSVVDAIRKHTTASIDMSDLDKIIYIADAIEPSRCFDIAEELRGLVGKSTLDELYYRVYKFWTIALIQHDRALHPDTMKIWNALAETRAKDKKER